VIIGNGSFLGFDGVSKLHVIWGLMHKCTKLSKEVARIIINF